MPGSHEYTQPCDAATVRHSSFGEINGMHGSCSTFPARPSRQQADGAGNTWQAGRRRRRSNGPNMMTMIETISPDPGAIRGPSSWAQRPRFLEATQSTNESTCLDAPGTTQEVPPYMVVTVGVEHVLRAPRCDYPSAGEQTAPTPHGPTVPHTRCRPSPRRGPLWIQVGRAPSVGAGHPAGGWGRGGWGGV